MSSTDPQPQSPRIGEGNDRPTAAGAVAALPGTADPLLAQTAFLDAGAQRRPNVGSMLFLTAFFFFMSSSNNQAQIIIVGPDGQIQQRVTELDRARTQVDEYKGMMNGTSVGNWTEGPVPWALPADLLPSRYSHSSGPFYTNITGFHRAGVTHTVDLLKPLDAHSKSATGFFDEGSLPAANSTAHDALNATLAGELRGSWDWSAVDKWEMNVKERSILPAKGGSNVTGAFDDAEWSWVKGVITLSGSSNLTFTQTSLDFDFRGLHHLPSGTFELYAMPDGTYLDVRNIPRLYPTNQNITRGIIWRELEKELEIQEASLLLTDVRPDGEWLAPKTRSSLDIADTPVTTCPLFIHLALPPIPPGVDVADVTRYDEELRHPSGLRMSLRRPPSYWQDAGLGGVLIADQCGIAIGLDGGTGMKLEDFWRKTCNCTLMCTSSVIPLRVQADGTDAAFATAALLLVLYLLVREMEITRTPSTLAQVSFWSIALMVSVDSFIFSSHVAVGTVSDNKTSLPLLVPGFLSLCTAVIFGPVSTGNVHDAHVQRYAVLLFRVQAPERSVVTVRPVTPVAVPAADLEMAEAGAVPADPPRAVSLTARTRESIDAHPRIKCGSFASRSRRAKTSRGSDWCCSFRRLPDHHGAIVHAGHPVCVVLLLGTSDLAERRTTMPRSRPAIHTWHDHWALGTATMWVLRWWKIDIDGCRCPRVPRQCVLLRER
jgi:hypothetical protein